MLTEQKLIDLLDKYNIKHRKASPIEVKATLRKLDKYMEKEFGTSVQEVWRKMKKLSLIEINTRERFRIMLDQNELGPYTLDRDNMYLFPDSVGCYKDSKNKWCVYNVSFYRDVYSKSVFYDQVSAYKEMGRRLGLSKDFSVPSEVPTIKEANLFLYRIRERNELAKKYRMGYSLDYEIDILEKYIESEKTQKKRF